MGSSHLLSLWLACPERRRRAAARGRRAPPYLAGGVRAFMHARMDRDATCGSRSSSPTPSAESPRPGSSRSSGHPPPVRRRSESRRARTLHLEVELTPLDIVRSLVRRESGLDQLASGPIAEGMAGHRADEVPPLEGIDGRVLARGDGGLAGDVPEQGHLTEE